MIHLKSKEGESESSLATRIAQYEEASQAIIDDINLRWDAERELRDSVFAVLEAKGLSEATHIYTFGNDSIMKHAKDQEKRDEAIARREAVFALFDAKGIDPKAKTTYDLGYNAVVGAIENEMWDRAEQLHVERG
jgi:hypothetical protein